MFALYKSLWIACNLGCQATATMVLFYMPFSQGDGISFFGALNMSNLYCCESCEFFSDCKGNRQKCVKQTFDEVLSTLSLREAQLLKYLYGYDGVKHTLADANREMRVVGESLQQVKARAGRKLRHPSRSKRLRDFFYICKI